MNILNNKIYNETKEEIYLKYNIVDINNVKKRKEELFQLNDYLPLLIRDYLEGYFTRMENEGVIDEIFEKMRQIGKHKSREDSVKEFIEWIEKHKEFDDLLNKNTFKKIRPLYVILS